MILYGIAVRFIADKISHFRGDENLIDVRDRVVQNPHRYQLVPVAGQEGVYDIVAVPGTITEAGTAVNRALFNGLQSDIPQASFPSFRWQCKC